MLVPLLRVAEVAFITADVGKAQAFYRDVLGLDIGGEAMSVNFGEVGEQVVGYALEGRVRGLKPVSAGKIHLAFEVAWEDIDRAKEALDRRGIPNAGPVIFPHHFHGCRGSRAVYLEDPDGNQLELWARPPEKEGGEGGTVRE